MAPLLVRMTPLASGALLISALVATAFPTLATATPDSSTNVTRINKAAQPTAQTSPAGVQSYQTTIDPSSAVRSSPFPEQGKTYWYTTPLDSAIINCYEHTTRKNDGHVSPDVWYHITHIDDHDHGTLTDVWSWGGNVNTPHDPPPGLSNC